MADQDVDTLPGEPTIPFAPLFTGSFAAPQTPKSVWSRPAEGHPPAPADLLVAPAADGEPVEVPVESTPASGPPFLVPGAHQFLKRWHFVAVVAGVWVVAAAVGVGFYYWWYQSLDKSPSEFAVLVYLVVCTVVGLILAMAQQKPLVAALAIAVMSAPLASTGAAAVLHGAYYFEWIARPTLG